jgi:outer membrane protein
MTGKKLTWIAIGGFLIIGAYLVYERMNKPRLGFIVIQQVFEGFSMKKEYENKFTAVKNARLKILDSLQLQLKLVANKLDQQNEKKQEDILEFKNGRDIFMQRKEQFENDNATLSAQYDQEILTQLNQYVKDFGEKNGYTYIFGNDGNGSLMYAEADNDLTKQIIEYVNGRYKGLGK